MIDRTKCISGDFRSSKFQNFLEQMPLTPLDNLAPSVLVSNNPKYAVWSVKVEYTVLLIPVYLVVGIIGGCGKKKLKLFVRDTVFLRIMSAWFEELPVILHTDSLLIRLSVIVLVKVVLNRTVVVSE